MTASTATIAGFVELRGTGSVEARTERARGGATATGASNDSDPNGGIDGAALA
jgi:hypothetical protein